MEIRRDLTYALGALIAAGLIVSFASIGLFMRMGPAIERIRRDNVATMDAARDILVVFTANAGEALDPDERARVEKALGRAAQNVTIENEQALVQATLDAVARAMEGDRSALGEVALAADALAQANSDAMWEADGEAQRLGVAGAWSAALGGLALVMLGVYALGRMRRRVLAPLAELERVLDAVRRGDEHARCKPLRGAVELEGALKNANVLIDRLHKGVSKVSSMSEAQSAGLVAMLEREKTATWLVSVAEGVLAANQLGHDDLSSRGASDLRQRLDIAARNGRADGVEVIPIERGRLAIVKHVPGWPPTAKRAREGGASVPPPEAEASVAEPGEAAPAAVLEPAPASVEPAPTSVEPAPTSVEPAPTEETGDGRER